MQMRRYHIRFGKINHVFISHLHGDHFFGLYPLLSTYNLMGRKTLLNIYAPAPVEEMLNRHLADFDINLGYELVIHPLKGRTLKLILSDKYAEVFCFPLKHRVKTYGFLFREKQADRNIIQSRIAEHSLTIAEISSLKKGKDILRETGEFISCDEMTLPPPSPASFAFCSDTGYFPKLSSFVAGVGLLYHEATFGDEHDALARQTGHSTARHAAMVAREAGVQRLLLGHFSARYKSPAALEEEARQVFPATEAAVEGKSYDISSPEEQIKE
jgi:ribonuclease Z